MFGRSRSHGDREGLIADAMVRWGGNGAIGFSSEMLSTMPENAITEAIIGKAIRVHRILGPGLLEKTYEECLAYELRSAGFEVEQQKHLPLVYETVQLSDAYRIDLLVNNAVVVELKTVEVITQLHAAQILTYLRFSHTFVGLILNFNSEVLRQGIKRVVNQQVKTFANSANPRSPIIISPTARQ